MLALAVWVPVVLFAGRTPTQAQTLYSEPFDSQLSAKVVELQNGETAVTFVDYSDFQIEGVSHSIPEAPNPIAGAAPTRGVLLQVNHLGPEAGSGTLSVINLVAADAPGGNPITFSGSYRITFDAYLSLDPLATSTSAGTTEELVWGVGSDASIAIGRTTRTSGFGTWGWLSNEGGFTSEDAAFFIDATRQADLDNTADAALFAEAFPDGAPLPNTPNNHWVPVEIAVLGEEVVVRFNGVEFFRLPSTATVGSAFIGYEDPFVSITFSHAWQWGLFDNFVVESADEPTILVRQAAPFPIVTEETTVTATFEVENASGDSELTVTALNVTGPDADAFVGTTPLPLVIEPGTTGLFEVAFLAGGANGIKSATLEVVSDDPQDPSLTLPLEAVFAPFLLGHYRFDESAGPSLVDSSGGGFNGAYEERDPIAFGEPPLAGSQGTSVRFQEATFAPLGGNFAFITSSLHTPSLSVSVWINPEADGSGADVLFNRDPGFTGDDRIYGCFIDELGRLTFRAGGIVVAETLDGVIEDGRTHHVVVTHLDSDGFGNDTADRTRIYVDGVLQAENLQTTGFDAYPDNAATRSLYLATRSAAGTGYSGHMDDLQIYSAELDAFQVESLFANPGTLAPTGPAPLFRITSIDLDAVSGDVTLTWNSRPGAFYTIFKSNDGRTWIELTDGVPSAGTSTTFVDTEEKSDEPNRFYQVTEE